MKNLVSLFILFSLASVNCFAEIAVIVASDSSISDTDANALERLFLGKESSINGNKATPLNQDNKAAVTEAFNKEVLKKSSSQAKAYWSKLVFTGKGTPPKEVDGDAAMIAAVSSDSSAVGYVDASAVTEAVKIIYRF